MDSASFTFVLFGLLVAAISNFSQSPAWRSSVLLLSSILFVCLLTNSGFELIPLAGFLLLGYLGIRLLGRGNSSALAWSAGMTILAFFWLKKYTFLPAATFLHFPYFTLGLSYIFFRVLQLLIEAEGGTEIARRISPAAYLNYTLNFTTLVSGPIQHYEEFAAYQFAASPLPLGAAVIGQQIQRIVVGFFKVNVLALLLNMIREDAVLQVSSQILPFPFKVYAAFKLAVVYPFFLYCNFSGYIDIVIAIARLMRLQLPENFNRPFSAPSFLEFWNRWHMTLSNWLKTYVYNPLLLFLMRRVPSQAVEPFLAVFCFFVTFFLIGIWHGRTSEFAVYGVLLGGGVAINKLWQLRLTKSLGRKNYKFIASKPLYISCARGLTFTFFSFSLFWFWGDWLQLGTLLHSIGMAAWIMVWASVWLVGSFLLSAWVWLREVMKVGLLSSTSPLNSRYARVVYTTALALGAFVMTALLDQSAPDIVYKAF